MADCRGRYKGGTNGKAMSAECPGGWIDQPVPALLYTGEAATRGKMVQERPDMWWTEADTSTDGRRVVRSEGVDSGLLERLEKAKPGRLAVRVDRPHWVCDRVTNLTDSVRTAT
jgi:hypothetical protein